MYNNNYSNNANNAAVYNPFPPSYKNAVKFGERYSLGGYVAGIVLRENPNILTVLNQRTLMLFAEQLVDRLNGNNNLSMGIDDALNNLFSIADEVLKDAQNHGPSDMKSTRVSSDTAQKVCTVLGFFFGYNKVQGLGNNLSKDIWNKKYGNNNRFGLNFRSPAHRELLFLLKSATNLFYQNTTGNLGRSLHSDNDYANFVKQVLGDTLDVCRFGVGSDELRTAHSNLMNYIMNQ